MISVKVLRRQKGLTQAELSKMADVSQPHISGIEKGEKVPSLNTAKKLARALGCSVDELFGDDDQREKNESAANGN